MQHQPAEVDGHLSDEYGVEHHACRAGHVLTSRLGQRRDAAYLMWFALLVVNALSPAVTVKVTRSETTKRSACSGLSASVGPNDSLQSW